MAKKTPMYSTSCFIGTTSRGVEVPVFWDTHTQIYNVGAPTTLITGAPGSGKTFYGLTKFCQDVLCGHVSIALDPKGDFLPLINLKDELGEIKIWNIGDTTAKNRNKGVLDPFYMAKDKGEQLELVLTTISMFLDGGLRDEQMQAVAPIIKDVAQTPNPSLSAVVDEMRMSINPIARQVGTQLDLISRLPAASVCFSPGTRKRQTVDLGSGATIITMVGLDLPAEGQQKLSSKQRLASTIFFLVTDFIRRTMHQTDDTISKTVVIDEAWAVLATPEGQDTIKALALLGRSKNLALVLCTQTPMHLSNTPINNTIATRFAFRTSNDDAPLIVDAMRLPKGGGFEELLCELNKGECLMSDAYGRFGTVTITSFDKKWKAAFETNPLEKLRMKKERESAAKAGQ